jgi:hypothetical protein
MQGSDNADAGSEKAKHDSCCEQLGVPSIASSGEEKHEQYTAQFG